MLDAKTNSPPGGICIKTGSLVILLYVRTVLEEMGVPLLALLSRASLRAGSVSGGQESLLFVEVVFK